MARFSTVGYGCAGLKFLGKRELSICTARAISVVTNNHGPGASSSRLAVSQESRFSLERVPGLCCSVTFQPECMRMTKLRNGSILATIAFLAILGLSLYPSAYAWDSSPQITSSSDGSGNTILTITFDFSQMSDPPSGSHYPKEFQVRTSTDGMSWTELSPVPLSPTPTTTKFTVTYNLGPVSGLIQVQARLNCSIHGWSSWGPDPAVPVPEFPAGTVALTSVLLMLGSLLLLRRKRPATAT